MIERTVTIVPEDGLHARPASKFVETANEYDSEITVKPEGSEAVNAASMLAVTGIGAKSGDEVVLTADGPDEEAAIEAVAAVLTTPESEYE
ncbi:HPr family phosphocarrier protein [Natranaeroarchaeum sulfidigenes]|uniref:Phosphotransferase system HPr-related protein n=1 Tax=Natranaeroarchaeum sulfidigenes TaxID=2784880 RepID=A0A897MLG6_9EURY|nr:HPr family phosphocarrier protein [Natranaeroarchaeum sulfidigenes]QSG01457.1 Phosphotransferase system HPr-related protein [Natranaeroarchaeum sulfidigenes]